MPFWVSGEACWMTDKRRDQRWPRSSGGGGGGGWGWTDLLLLLIIALELHLLLLRPEGVGVDDRIVCSDESLGLGSHGEQEQEKRVGG